MFADELLATQKSFAGGAGESYVVVATDGVLPEGKTETFTFQQVDVATQAFLSRYERISFASPADAGGNFQTPATMAAASMRFAGRRVTPGDYALVYVSNPDGGVSFHCYSEGAPIYRFREGAISIVRQGTPAGGATSVCRAALAAHAADHETVRAQVAEVLNNYPEMTAPLVVAPLLGTARCDPGESFRPGTPCTANDRFSFARSLALPHQGSSAD
jgi:hypothetical protein